MTRATKSRSRKGAALQRAAMVAAAGIAAAADMGAADAAGPAIAPPTMAGHAIGPEHIRMTATGVAIHSEALARGLRMNRPGTIRELQARFPGLRPDQVALGPGDTVEFRMGLARFKGHLDAGDNGTCSNVMCGSRQFMPGPGPMERTR